MTDIHWPDHLAPGRAPVHVRNELEIAASPERVWAWLVRAPQWPRWYVNSADVRILSGPASELAAGTQFRWRTFGVAITSTVREWVPPTRLAWDAHSLGVEAYHAWLITPTADGCHV